MKDEQYRNNLELQPYEYYLKQFQQITPHFISSNTDIPYSEVTRSFQLHFLGSVYKVTHPDFQVKYQGGGNGVQTLVHDIYAQILLLRYLLEGNYQEPSGGFLSYTDLPWGETYFRQFSGRCIAKFAGMYGKRQAAFREVMESLQAIPMSYGDLSYKFELFNSLYLCFVLWSGDEEFEPTAQILFSDNFPLAFSAEDAAYIGDVVLRHMKEYEKQLADEEYKHGKR